MPKTTSALASRRHMLKAAGLVIGAAALLELRRGSIDVGRELLHGL